MLNTGYVNYLSKFIMWSSHGTIANKLLTMVVLVLEYKPVYFQKIH